jgi:hypothetical protein
LRKQVTTIFGSSAKKLKHIKTLKPLKVGKEGIKKMLQIIYSCGE